MKTFKEYLAERIRHSYDDAEDGHHRAAKHREMSWELRHEDPEEYKRMHTPPKRYHPKRVVNWLGKKTSK